MPKLFKGSLWILILFATWFFGTGVFFVFLSVTLLKHSSKTPLKQEANYSIYLASPKDPKIIQQAISSDDVRPVILDQYFASQGAPLAGYGKCLVVNADKYGLDWRLLAAIAMQESNGGKKIPRDSCNAWGWAIFTGKDSGTYFDSWEHAIETVSKGLATYRDKYGLVTPEEIMTRYTPDSSANGGSWAKGVRYFMNLFLPL